MSDNPEPQVNQEEEGSEERQEDRPVWVSTKDAATIFGEDPRTVRKKIQAGKYEAQMVGNAYMVRVTRDQAMAAGVDLETLEADHGEVPAGMQGGTVVLRSRDQEMAPVDIQPLADVIERLHEKLEAAYREVGEAQATAAALQERVRHLEEKDAQSRLALESGLDRVDPEEVERRVAAAREEGRAAGRSEALAERTAPDRPWWKRLLG